MDKQGVLALGVTAGVGLGYLVGRSQSQAISAGVFRSTSKSDKKNGKLDEVEQLIRPNILALTPYRCARDDYDQGILLDANENSLGPSLGKNHPLAQAQLERYPCPFQNDLKQAIADFRNENSSEHMITPANIFLGVGSDEAIDLLIRVACTPRVDSILITPPTYGMYEVCANIHDVGVISAPLCVEAHESNPKGLKDDPPLPSFHIKPQQILAAVTDKTKIIFLCSPGNPTANSLRFSDIEAILTAKEYKGFVVVDEAYIDFAEDVSLCTLVNKYNRLVVLQTLSKGFGLAGIRLGSAFANRRLVQIMNNVKAPYNINTLTAKAAHEVLKNLDELRANVSIVKKEKVRIMKKLRSFSFVKCIYESDSNFILFELPHAHAVYKEMPNRGVVIRYRGNQLLLKDCLRATIGNPEENNRMLELLDEVSSEYF